MKSKVTRHYASLEREFKKSEQFQTCNQQQNDYEKNKEFQKILQLFLQESNKLGVVLSSELLQNVISQYNDQKFRPLRQGKSTKYYSRSSNQENHSTAQHDELDYSSGLRSSVIAEL